MTHENLGYKLTPVLEEIEIALLEHQLAAHDILCFPRNGTRAAIKIFMDVMLAEMWKLQDNEDMDIETRGAMAESMGNELRVLIRKYTNLDTYELYPKQEKQ